MSNRPRIADLFCGAGGAGMGLHRAGFEVVGFDIEPQPNYPFEFHQADALTVDLEGFAAVWASPPCQGYAVTSSIPNRDFSKYPKLIEPVRGLVKSAGLPYVIENTPGAPLRDPLMLCGSMFGLRTRRHRLFETKPIIHFAPFTCNHSGRVKPPGNGKSLNIYTGDDWQGNVTVAGHLFSLKAGSQALGIDWMTRAELAEAIPPAYSEFIGRHLISTGIGKRTQRQLSRGMTK